MLNLLFFEILSFEVSFYQCGAKYVLLKPLRLVQEPPNRENTKSSLANLIFRNSEMTPEIGWAGIVWDHLGLGSSDIDPSKNHLVSS